MMEAWHFIKEDRTMQYSGEKVEAGKTYVFHGEPRLCEQGYHASLKAIDALYYSPGSVICRVRMGGEIVTGEDKIVATERHVIWMHDATEQLREFARWCALQVAHLWDMPVGVRQYLETGDETLRDAARAAARAAARDAAGAAAGAAEEEKQNKKLEQMLMGLES